ncbi:hypothetical protein N9C81_00855 [Planctomycetota bacterium]|nr:hypothetical protein [Planctomycetota bacterium]
MSLKKSASKFFILLPLLASCQADMPGRRLLEIGTGSDTTIAFGAFEYLEEGVGVYAAMHGSLGEGSGTNYDGIIASGGFPGDSKTGETTVPTGLSAGITHRIGEKFGVFAGPSLTLLTTYYNYYDNTLILDSSGNYNITGEEETKAGLEVGAHFFLNDRHALGVRQDLGTNTTIISIGFNF